ncbi:GNAT family N-acetyltransferase [Paenibacillus sp. sptzw28]|uniref:GNAT family N-acetyltransferase n=1 Tax=Paenibacillus sp. sptzw28 TaxID=715179 RepID=UPI001C6DE120|nr:GNAT family N-acetyltransferase [Paenibacillus sp. sptzw28]QYR22991.1 GNAT family N-acetyltransferase [Paenibacillus sp. sptzw28]
MKYVYDYKTNERYRDSFNRLALQIFGIQFDEWYRKGLWDERYICHSFLYEDEIVANVSISKMGLVVNGLKKSAIQIGTVMTHPECRGRGLSASLMNRVLEHYEQDCDFFFLFANKSVLDLYPKFGFNTAAESQFSLDIKDMPRGMGSNSLLRKLSIEEEEDLSLIERKLRTRRTVSRRFGVENDRGIFMFHALNMFRDCLYYSESSQAIIVCKHEGKTLHLYDVISSENVDFTGLLIEIGGNDTTNVQFYFTPDIFTCDAKAEPLDQNEDQLFVKSASIVIPLEFRFPLIAHA